MRRSTRRSRRWSFPAPCRPPWRHRERIRPNIFDGGNAEGVDRRLGDDEARKSRPLWRQTEERFRAAGQRALVGGSAYVDTRDSSRVIAMREPGAPWRADDQDLALAATVFEAELRALLSVELPRRRRSLQDDGAMSFAPNSSISGSCSLMAVAPCVCRRSPRIIFCLCPCRSRRPQGGCAARARGTRGSFATDPCGAAGASGSGLAVSLAWIGRGGSIAPPASADTTRAATGRGPITHDWRELFGKDQPAATAGFRLGRGRRERGCGLHPDSASRNRLQIDANFSRFARQSSSLSKSCEKTTAPVTPIGRCAGRVGRVLISSSVVDLWVHIALSVGAEPFAA